MKYRPILMSAPMVRSTLRDLDPKQQTRRIAKLTSNGHVKEPGGHRRWHPDDPDAVLACPYGQPGDRLWVRETWAVPHRYDHLGPSNIPTEGVRVHYAATEERGGLLWRPSIHMCRWASRIALEITRVRLERLHRITEADCIAEGIEKTEQGFWSLYGQHNVDGTYSPKSSFCALWMSINGAESWHDNPYVWAVDFKRLPIPSQDTEK